MGKVVAKLTGADKAAAAARESAQIQAEATRRSAEAASKASQEAAQQAARQQESAAARNAAESAAADALDKPMEEADVNVAAPDGGGTAQARKRRQQFGLGSGSTGVNI